jgi:hypothetical protein
VTAIQGAAVSGTAWVHLAPYASCLAGVLLFIMMTSCRKRERWALRDYWGDHCFRIAQAFAYLFVVRWAWAQGMDKDLTGTNVPPNILGFLVGFFILRVERAMEGMGTKLEEVLMAILPRSMGAVSAEERRRQQLRTVFRLDEVTTQYDAIRSSLDDKGARDFMEDLLARASAFVDRDEPDEAKELVRSAAAGLEEMKRRSTELLVPLEELLGRESRRGPTSGQGNG